MQIRFCIHCDYKKRDDNFEINNATRNNPESRYCPNCGGWLWSMTSESDEIEEHDEVEIDDWDENTFHLWKEHLGKLMKTIEGML